MKESVDPAAAKMPTVHPRELMAGIQRVIVDGSCAIVLAESGNAFAWTTSSLTFDEPGRYRASLICGSLGHASGGVLGAALAARPVLAAAVVGDGAMLYRHPIHTAVSRGIDNVMWIVLNDGRYGSAWDGQTSRGLSTYGLAFHRVDFVAYARSMGADGVQVTNNHELDEALHQALHAGRPFVVDVHVDHAPSPLSSRFARFFAGRRP